MARLISHPITKLTPSRSGRRSIALRTAVYPKIQSSCDCWSKAGGMSAQLLTALRVAKQTKANSRANTHFLLSLGRPNRLPALAAVCAVAFTCAYVCACVNFVLAESAMTTVLLPEDAVLYTQTRAIAGIKIRIRQCDNKDCGARFYPNPWKLGQSVSRVDSDNVQAFTSIQRNACTRCLCCGIFGLKWCTVWLRRQQSKLGPASRSFACHVRT
jgi:hypothetical protein